jgi:glycosyltransferase involved in cell wall biosynthesis
VEGFGYGVLEMLASSIPVIAFDAPGPNVMLTPEFLAPVGDTTTLARRVIDLFADPAGLQVARRWARSRALDFTWDRIGEQTARAYEDRMARPRA